MSSAAVTIIAAIAVFTGAQMASAADRTRLAVFDMELQDASHEGALHGKRDDEAKRVALVSAELRKLVEATGRYELVDLTPAHDKIAERRPLRSCKGCDVEIAKSFGAAQSILGVVYKVSNLILEIHIYLRDTETGQVINYMRANIRGNTDESWLRGVRWLMRNRFEPKN